MKALITGVAGFVGSHLTAHLKNQKISVSGIIHPRHPNGDSFKKEGISIIKCDLTNKKEVFESLKNENFDFIFHLAGFSSPADSFKNPKKTLENNIFGQLNLLEHLAEKKSKAKILIVGSSDEYGNVDKKDLPVNEETPLAPVSPYAVSKVAQDLLGLQFYLHKALKVVRVRPFNHIGPGQSPNFVVSSFASQIARIEKEGGEIRVGNLNSWRDFTDVRDIVKAYLLALVKGKEGEVYNIGSGKQYKIGDVLEKLISLSKAKIKVVVDRSLYRPSEIERIYCDFSKFRKRTGWNPKIPIEKSLFDTIKYERSRIN